MFNIGGEKPRYLKVLKVNVKKKTKDLRKPKPTTQNKTRS